MAPFAFRILGHSIRIQPATAADRDCVHANFAAFADPSPQTAPADLAYDIARAGHGYAVHCTADAQFHAAGLDDLLFRLEKDIVVRLQQQRADLLFLHAAVVEWRGRAMLLAADSGSGKSTTTWALLHHGFGYLSDELGPVDLGSGRVVPYPHALCLKRPSPPPYELPGETLHLGRTLHVPTSALPAATVTAPLPVGAVFLLRHDSSLDRPQLRPISAAEAGARLYLTALNALAHADRGLDAVLGLAAQVPCYMLISAGLPATCQLIRETLDRDAPCSSSNC